MPQLEIEVLPALSDNYVYLLHEPQSGATAVVDPATADVVETRLVELDRVLDLILITHHHADHTGGLATLKAKHGCKVIGPAAEADKIPGLDELVSGGDEVRVGEVVGRVFDTPGHTAGHISYAFAGALFSADVLFSLGCGRLFEGTAAQMLGSMHQYDDLPDDTLVYCGHEYTLSNAKFALSVEPGNQRLRDRAREVEALRAKGLPTIPTTLGLERATNPFLRWSSPEIRRTIGLAGATDAEVFAEVRRRKDNF